MFNSKEYQYIVEGLKLRLKETEEKIKDRMIETGIYFGEEDEKLDQLQKDKRSIDELTEKLIKDWRTAISNENT